MQTKESGQVLLVTVMLLAVALTVALSVSFTQRTDTQLTKLEEENQKGLAAAEAGIEAALKQGTVADLSTLNVPAGFTGQATVSEAYDKRDFTSPLVQKDDQFTFYLGAYDSAANTIGASTSENVTVCFGSISGTQPAVEITLIKSGNSLKRYVVDPSSRIPNAFSSAGACSVSGLAYSYTIPAADISTTAKVLVVRQLYSQSKLAIVRPSTNLPPQGKFVRSEATSQAGVSKKVELFQSYPQIPADFSSIGF